MRLCNANPTTHQQWEAANALAASLAAAKGAYWPTAIVTSATKPSYTRVPTFPGYARTTELDYNPTLQVQYLLFDFGGRKAGVDAARLNLLASEFAINQTLQTVALQVLKSYYTLQQAIENERTSNDSLNEANERIKYFCSKITTSKPELQELEKSGDLKSLQQRFPALREMGEQFGALSPNKQKELIAEEKANTETKVNLFKEQAILLAPNAASFEFNVASARGAEAAARVQLATSIGLPGNTRLNVKSPGDPPNIAFLTGAIDHMIDMALQSRPDIANKYASYQSARALARQAKSNIYPNVMATLIESTTEFDKTVRDDTSRSGRSDNFLGALTVTIPVFDGLTLVNKARAARWNAEAAKADLANSELNAIADVVASFEAYKSAVEQYQVAIALRQNAQSAFDTAQGTYNQAWKDFKLPPKTDPKAREGELARIQGALNTFLNAQTARDGAKTTLTQAKFNVFATSFQLTNATGALLPVVTPRGKKEIPSVLFIPLSSKVPTPLPSPTCNPSPLPTGNQ